MEPLKPLAARVWRRNQDIYNEYHMTDQIISDLKAILKTNSKDGSNLQLIWLRLLVWTLKSLQPQSVGIVLGITFLLVTVKVPTFHQLLLL